MKKGKIITIVIVIIGILLGIIFGISKIISSIKEDQEKTRKQMEEISVYYDKLNENALSFNTKKQELDTLMEATYYTTVPKNNPSFLKILEEYDAIISQIIENGNKLEEMCSIYYRDSDTMQKCSSYKISYESAMTVFKTDVERYNTLVENYNNWTKENPSYQTISAYVSDNLE